MCSGDAPQLRDIGDSEMAAGKGNMKKYRELGGAEGDLYRKRVRELQKQGMASKWWNPETDRDGNPLTANTGIFKMVDEDVPGDHTTGAEDLRSKSSEAALAKPTNPFYQMLTSKSPSPATSGNYGSAAVARFNSLKK